MGKKREHKSEYDENEYDIAPKSFKEIRATSTKKRLIIILENAQLETVKVGNKYELLSNDRHSEILKKNNRDPGSSRPDITHQCLLMLQDSPLNKNGYLQIYVHTEKNVLMEIHRQTKIPTDFDEFAELMVYLLHKNKVRASKNASTLLKVIKNPVTNYLPAGCQKILMSFSADGIKDPEELVPDNEPIAFVIGAMAHGQVKADYTEETVSINSLPLSGALTCTELCLAFEKKWTR
ncbi:ribosomal RNA small subunit methyltransferase NEP1-like [Microplitis mediator]|uniref:ribosomal RNA small subunit methyltransferase NEP1-like n=1 Tax=Microplitis mediator TaxID=375433 RepID=UPI002554A1F9|nr:ribosomal RNA small subunit methyltransferase NEP1-like [Microplitis mediator]